jgi:hypothetical protein
LPKATCAFLPRVGGEGPAFLEAANDVVSVWQIGNVVALLRVGLQRKNLAVHSEATDSVLAAELKGGGIVVSPIDAPRSTSE